LLSKGLKKGILARASPYFVAPIADHCNTVLRVRCGALSKLRFLISGR